MATAVIIAKDFDVVVGGHTVGGLETITLSETMKEADITTKSSSGLDEHRKVRTTKELTCNGKFLMDTASGDWDAGQSAVQALAGGLFSNSVSECALIYPDDTSKTFLASAVVDSLGGGFEEGAAFNFKLKITGAMS